MRRTDVALMNPITDPLKPVFDKIFAPFIDLGVIEISPVVWKSAACWPTTPRSAPARPGASTHDAIVSRAGGRDAKRAGAPKRPSHHQ
jgi:aldehyde dehydrogenase (NAD(P)+)